MTGCLGQAGSVLRPLHDLVHASGRQGLAASWLLEHHKDAVGGRSSRALLVQIATDRGKEPARDGVAYAPIGTPGSGGGLVIRSARYQALLRRTAPVPVRPGRADRHLRYCARPGRD